MPRLLLVLRGISCSPPRDGCTKRPWRLPITGLVMHQLHGVLSNGQFESRLHWAAACVGFFGFMRVGKFTMDDLSPPPSLCMEDVVVNSRSNPSTIRLHLRRSKTDPTGEGVFTFWDIQALMCVRCQPSLHIWQCACQGDSIYLCGRIANPCPGQSLDTCSRRHSRCCWLGDQSILRPQPPYWCCNFCSSCRCPRPFD